MLELADKLLLAFALVAPLIVIWMLGYTGIFIGTILAWGSLVVAGWMLSQFDPGHQAGMLDSIWLLLGWLPSLVYCVAIFGAIQASKFSASWMKGRGKIAAR